MPAPRLLTAMLMLMTFLGVFALDVILPSVPALVQHFHTPAHAVTAGIGLFAVVVAIAQLMIGPASDRYGRKPLLLACMGIAALGALGCTLATSNEAFLAWRAMQAIGCGGFVLANALVQDLFTSAQRTQQRIWLSVASGVFISISPLFGVVLEHHLGWRGSFYGFVALALCTGLIAVKILPDKTKSLALQCAGATKQPAHCTQFILASAVTMVAFASHFSFVLLSPVLFMDTLALSTRGYGLLMLVYGASYVIGGVIASRATRYISESRQIRLGSGLIVVGGLLIAALRTMGATDTLAILTGACVVTFGVTLARPAATTLAMNAVPGQAGAAAAGLNTITFAGGGLVSFGLSLMAGQAITWLPSALMAMGAAGLALGALATSRALVVTAPTPE
jgi:predicted MFS family arabinose efflux permease